jgi:branched-chain amino acid transport system permease protein
MSKIKIDWKFSIILISVLILCFLPQMIRNVYWCRVFIEFFIWVVVCLGFRLILSTGELSLAQVAFMGIGAYTVGILTTRLGWNFWACWPLAGIVAAILALIVGSVSLRIKGFYFAIATFAISEIIRLIWIQWTSLFGGVGGIPQVPSPTAILGLKFGSPVSFYYLSLVLAIITALIMYRLDTTRFGLTVSTFEEADNLAESVGIHVMQYKLIAFVIASFFAGLAGALFATFYHYIGPEDFAIHQTFYVIIYALAGGAASVYGTLIGCFVIMAVLASVHVIPGYNPVWEPLILGGILILVMKFLPGGLIAIPQRISARIMETG